MIAVPLIVHQEVIGCLLFSDASRGCSAEAEIDFARQLGATVSLAVDNARLYLEQRRIAQTLQENFIHELPDVAGLELGVVSQAAAEPELVGGDFSDVFVVDDSPSSCSSATSPARACGPRAYRDSAQHRAGARRDSTPRRRPSWARPTSCS